MTERRRLIPACIVMAGGAGSRMGGVAKPLLELGGRRLLDHVASMLLGVCRAIIVAMSPHVEPPGSVVYERLYTPGLGYVEDLRLSLSIVKRRPVLVSAADVVELREGCLEMLVEEALRLNASIVTFVARGEPIGVSLFHHEAGDWVDVEAGWCLADIDTWGDYSRVAATLEGSRGQRPERLHRL